MANITHSQFQMLKDYMEIYDFMSGIYEKDWRNGVPAPFLEYALHSSWMDRSLIHRSRVWRHNGKIVAFCFYEAPLTDVYFSLNPQYSHLAAEMVAHAEKHMPEKDGHRRLVLFGGQDALMEAATAAGFSEESRRGENIYCYDKPLEYPLPRGFRFTDPGQIDVAKTVECCWKGFDHEEKEGPWNGEFEHGFALANAPHATYEHAIAIENEAGEYVCYAGMWWTPQNNLAYMEPLCTVPNYRKKGLAAAILSEMARRMRPLGADHMTGGFNEFYKKIGFEPIITWTFWSK